MKILVLGATGMAGHVISIYLQEAGFDVTTFSRSQFNHSRETIQGDITDFSLLKKIVINGKFDAVINAIGILNQDAEDNKANSILVNGYLPHFLVDITKNTKTKIIHMSTDCVFSGKAGGYTEESAKDGQTYYDQTKALGEINNSKDLTFRNSIIGPDMNENGIGLFNWFMKQQEPIHGYSKAIWTGVTTLTLAKAMEKALNDNLTGLYHLVNNQKINKYELLLLINKYFKENHMIIHPNDSFEIDKSLINTRTDFLYVVPSYEEMIQEMYNWVQSHKELYPHYF